MKLIKFILGIVGHWFIGPIALFVGSMVGLRYHSEWWLVGVVAAFLWAMNVTIRFYRHRDVAEHLLHQLIDGQEARERQITADRIAMLHMVERERDSVKRVNKALVQKVDKLKAESKGLSAKQWGTHIKAIRDLAYEADTYIEVGHKTVFVIDGVGYEYTLEGRKVVKNISVGKGTGRVQRQSQSVLPGFSSPPPPPPNYKEYMK